MTEKRSALGVPYIRSDGMNATWNPADGRTYESKSQYERAVKAAGCEIVGTDSALEKPPPSYKTSVADVKQDLIQTIRQAGG
jgi:hypothetical protein